MQTKKINSLPLPAATPRAVSPAKTEGGQLFASELDRASGGDGVLAHRNQREAGDTRRAAQASRADANDQTRAEAREGRDAGERTRKEKRTERLDAGDAAVAMRGETPQPRTPQPRPADASVGRRQEAANPATLAETNTEATDAGKAKATGAEAPSSGLSMAALMAAGLASSQVAAPTAQPSDVSNAAPTKVAPTRVAAADAPQTNTQERGTGTRGERASGPKTTPAAPADAMGDLLVEREAELDRQAQVLRQVQAQLGPSAREVSLILSPASLGTIQMRLALRSGRLTAVMRASERESLDALENQLPELTASLEAQGFDVVDFDLGLMGDPGSLR